MENKKITISRIMIFAINACLLYLVGKPFVGSLIYTHSEISKEWSYAIAEGITIALVIIMGSIERKNLVAVQMHSVLSLFCIPRPAGPS